MKKTIKILAIILGVLFVLFVGYLAYTRYLINKGDLVKWQGQWYTKEQIKQKYGEQEYNVESKNTPEEVYTKFREALLKNDIEGALSQMTEKSRPEYREAFKNKEKFDKWVKSLPNKITKERIDNNFGYYDVDYGTEYKNSMTFIKNIQGYWQIDII
jgi:hypothetical protein